MKRGLIIIVCFLLMQKANGQTRMYVAAGLTTSYGGGYNALFAKIKTPGYFDIELEKKILGSVSIVGGVSTFGVGYSSEDTGFGSQSSYQARFVSVPVLFRWNIRNKNFFFLDFGLSPYYLVNAHLQESIYKFGIKRDVEGDITGYSKRFFTSFKFQQTFAVNRLIISLFVIVPFKGQSSIKDLPDHWGLNQQQSTYLIEGGYKDFVVMGLKTGLRIK
ncbi:MAG: hypothetical protein ABL895_03270 [Cyclobacteriaceae bacterium]